MPVKADDVALEEVARDQDQDHDQDHDQDTRTSCARDSNPSANASDSASTTSEQLVLVPLEAPSLESLINSLSLNNRSSLFEELRNIYRDGHLHHRHWSALKDTHPHLLDTSFDLLRKYESNGLQLHGYGCWLFEQVIVAVGLPLECSEKQTPDQVLEVVLRVLLEHACYARCALVLHSVCSATPEHFSRLCDIGELSRILVLLNVCYVEILTPTMFICRASFQVTISLKRSQFLFKAITFVRFSALCSNFCTIIGKIFRFRHVYRLCVC